MTRVPAQDGDRLPERSEEAKATARRLRRFGSVKRQLVADCGGDPSQAQEAIEHNAAVLAIWCEEQVASMVKGDNVKIAELSTVMNTLRRLLESLGLERRMKDVTPSLDRYIAERSPKVINGHMSGN